MYVFQFQDGTYRIDFTMSCPRTFISKVYANETASRLFDRSYETRSAAEAAKKSINEMIGA